MVKCTAVFRAYGAEFSPGEIERSTGVRFSKKNERGEIGISGRFSGAPVPYGSGDLKVEVDLSDPDMVAFGRMEALVSACSTGGATDILLHIDVAFVDQCNLEMSASFMRAAARLNIPLTITCFEQSEGAEPGHRKEQE